MCHQRLKLSEPTWLFMSHHSYKTAKTKVIICQPQFIPVIVKLHPFVNYKSTKYTKHTFCHDPCGICEYELQAVSAAANCILILCWYTGLKCIHWHSGQTTKCCLKNDFNLWPYGLTHSNTWYIKMYFLNAMNIHICIHSIMLLKILNP